MSKVLLRPKAICAVLILDGFEHPVTRGIWWLFSLVFNSMGVVMAALSRFFFYKSSGLMEQQGNNSKMGPRIKCEDLGTTIRPSDLSRRSMGQQGNGFTLVELAIALMVIGLLIGGVLKGQELIENARITRMIKDIKDYDTAVMIFRTTYNDLPGDMRNPTRLPNCNAAPCNVVASDAGRGQIGDRDKSEQFWRHLFHAGLISSINEDPGYVDNFKTISPQNPFTHHTAIFFAPTGNPALTDEQGFNRYFLFDRTVSANGNGFLAHRALAIDSKIDDGKPLSGIAQVQHPESPIWLGATCFDGTEYLRTSGLRCSFSVISSSMND